MKHLPRRLLTASAHAAKRKQTNIGNKLFRTETAADLPDAGGDQQPWTRTDPELVGSKIPDFLKPVLSAEDQQLIDNLADGGSAYEYYKLFQPDSYIENVVYESKLYATQKNFSQKVIEVVTKDTYRCTEAFLLHSGYHSVPRRRMLWEQKLDCRNTLVAESIRRDKVDAMLKSLHFRDNSKMDDDIYFKVLFTFRLVIASIS